VNTALDLGSEKKNFHDNFCKPRSNFVIFCSERQLEFGKFRNKSLQYFELL